MSINFATLQGLTIPEGVIMQIADAAGAILWSAEEPNIPCILQVEKITSDTYASETTYSDEQFIRLSIYPKSAGSTVNVTYGGLTKTLTFSTTSAKQVYFGTFNGVSDSVSTPASGTLTIDGDYKNFAIPSHSTGKAATSYCSCITDVVDWGHIKELASYAFYGCTAFTLTSLPSDITSIGASAFTNCTGITSIHIPSSVKSIGADAFKGCNALVGTYITDMDAWIRISFGNADATPVKAPDGYLYLNNTIVTDVIIPSDVTKVSYTFGGCTTLETVSFHNNMTAIGDYAFANCTNLTLTSLPSGITSIGAFAFANCTNLALTSLPSGITSIGDTAFSRCTNLALTSLPSGITSIGDYAFSRCTNLALTSLPSGITSIGAGTFCAGYSDRTVFNMSMKEIAIHSGITSIGSHAFCATDLGDGTTGYKGYLEKVIMLGTEPPSISTGTSIPFGGASYFSGQIVVPAGCGDIYKAAEGWSSYANKIVEVS